jgi:hypothetical protein
VKFSRTGISDDHSGICVVASAPVIGDTEYLGVLFFPSRDIVSSGA